MTEFRIDQNAQLGFVMNPQTGVGSATGGNAPSSRMPNVQDDVAFRIRAELVCCHIYERVNDTHELTLEQAQQSRDWHDLCYWGEASARIAEGRCPGYETTPNVCRCGCAGCKHSCSAHQEETDAPVARSV